MTGRDRSFRLPFAAATPTSHLFVGLLVWWHLVFVAVQALAVVGYLDGRAEAVIVLTVNGLTALLAVGLLRVDSASGVSVPRLTYPLLFVAPPVGLLRYLLRVGED